MATNVNPDFGYFTSTGAAVYLPIRSGVDYFEIMNYTQMATTNATGQVVESRWQNGFSAGYAQQYTKTNSTDALNGTIATSNGFTLVDTSRQTGRLGSPVVTTGATNANPVVVSTGTTTGLVSGSTVVQLASTSGNYQLAGMQFTVGTVVGSTSFQLKYMSTPGDAAPGNGTYKIVNWEPMYAPRPRSITAVTTGTTTVIKLSVTHNFVVGEQLQIIMPAIYGMTQANNKIAKVLSVDLTNNTVTLDLDSSSYTAFTFPRASSVPFTFAQLLPIGEIPTISSQATQNASRLSMLLGTSVVGSANDVLFYRAWQAFTYSAGTLPTA